MLDTADPSIPMLFFAAEGSTEKFGSTPRGLPDGPYRGIFSPSAQAWPPFPQESAGPDADPLPRNPKSPFWQGKSFS